MSIARIQHPEYRRKCKDWYAYRLGYEGGDEFCRKYLLKYSDRESHEDFNRRICVTPIPAFAKTAVTEVRNAIFQRLSSVSRKGGSKKYQAAANGQQGGVDNNGSSMTTFLGREVLDELLVVERCGVLIEAPAFKGLIPPADFRPYLCRYRPEDIRSIRYGEGIKRNEIMAVTLRETHMRYDQQYGLPEGERDVYRRFWIDEDGYVNHQYIHPGKFDKLSREHGPDRPEQPTQLKLKRIPFVLGDIGASLMSDVVRHQVALLNVQSTAVNYSINSNFSLYVEQGDQLGGHLYKKEAGSGGRSDGRETEIQVGPLRGRRYQKGADAPSFINPSSEPVESALKVMQNLKDEIRQLVHLSVANLGTRTSGESKAQDQNGLEAGLSFIGLTLELMEREIARHWAAYENVKEAERDIATICYPVRWNLKSSADQIEEAEKSYSMAMKLPGNRVKKEASKQLANVLMQGNVSAETIARIHQEIDEAKYATSDLRNIEVSREQGLLSNATGAEALGYGPDEAKKAREDKMEQLRQTAAAQSSAPIQGADQTAAEARDQKRQERDQARGQAGPQPTRGSGRGNNEG